MSQHYLRKSSELSTQFFRNFFVAGISFVVDYGIFLSLKGHIKPLNALVIGYTAGLFVNYALSRVWVFPERHYKNELKQFGLFSFYAGTGLIVELLNFSIIGKFIPYQYARLLSIGIAYFWNFAMKELVVFRRKERIPLNNILSMYKGLDLGELIYLCIRFATAPVDHVARALPENGIVLEIGVGSGINLAYASKLHPLAEHIGLDIDPSKVLLAKKIMASNMEVTTDSAILTSRKWDAIAIIDVLYLMKPEVRESLIVDCAKSLTESGTLIIKEMSRKPFWKARWNFFQETIAVRVTGMTLSKTKQLSIWTTEEITSFMQNKGYRTKTTRLDARYVHPHVMLTITK